MQAVRDIETEDLLARLEVWAIDPEGIEAVKRQLARGDFAKPEHHALVEKWLVDDAARRQHEYLQSVEGSVIRQADAAVRQADASERQATFARRSLWISFAALVVSILAICFSLLHKG